MSISLTCKGCGAGFTARSRRAAYCSDRCGAKARGTAACARCGGPVWKTGGSRPAGEAVCKPCRKASPVPYKPPLVTTSCAVCKVDFEQPRKGYRRRTCSPRCQRAAQQRVAHPCADCGAEIPSTRKRCDDCRDAVLREHYQGKNRRRRAVKRQADTEPYTLAEIAERDRYRCQLCRRKVNMQLKSPHPRSPSIDHVIPIVEGGGDVRANVQLAHRGCNSSKGARGSQQLALVG
jgi:Restriction endonuclease